MNERSTSRHLLQWLARPRSLTTAADGIQASPHLQPDSSRYTLRPIDEPACAVQPAVHKNDRPDRAAQSSKRSRIHVVITERVRVSDARPTDRLFERRTARIAGIFLVITFISIPALPLYDQVLNHTHFIAGSGGDLRVERGALFEIVTLIAGIGTAVAIYPVLRRHSERLALGYVTVRVVESALRGRHRQSARSRDAAPGPRRRRRDRQRVAHP
ncbi:MAG: DUF4386 domain-containing protein [Solirubrobacteraceae bacterium]